MTHRGVIQLDCCCNSSREVLIGVGKVFDRMSKGIREAPGKALIGDLAAESGDRTEGAFGKPFYPYYPYSRRPSDLSKVKRQLCRERCLKLCVQSIHRQ